MAYYAYQRLSDSDVTLIRELLVVFGEAFKDPATYGNAPPSNTYLETLLQKQHLIVLVATENGNVVGGLVAYELEKIEQERSEVYIYDLAVSEPHRRRGIATTLINELKNVAKERGAYVLFVQADRGDTPAIQLYESLGEREDVHHFDIAIDSRHRDKK